MSEYFGPGKTFSVQKNDVKKKHWDLRAGAFHENELSTEKNARMSKSHQTKSAATRLAEQIRFWRCMQLKEKIP